MGGVSRRRRRATKDEEIGLSDLSVVIRLIRMEDYKLFWFKATPPDDLQINKDHHSSCCFLHSHNDDISNFYQQDVEDMNTDDFTSCKYPLLLCTSACIGTTLYFAGGDKDIDCDVRIIDCEIIGPPLPRRPTNYLLPHSNSNSNNKKNLSHRIGSYDFSNPLREQIDYTNLENAPQLVSPRYRPKVVAVGGKVFFFGGNAPLPPHQYAPFAEVFDPETGLCSPIKDPPFPCRIGHSHLFVAPLIGKRGEKYIVVMSHARRLFPGYDSISLYHVGNDSWEIFSDPERVLFRNSLSIIGNPVPVPRQDSIYWLKATSDIAYICSYNWKIKQFWEGPFIGLHHEPPFVKSRDDRMILLHMRQDLFCVVWHSHVRSSTSSCYDRTHLHFTLFRVSREDHPSCHLSAFVVGCFSYVLPGCNLLDGYCLQQH